MNIQKIEGLIKQCISIPKKPQYNIGLKTTEEVKEYFPGFLSFTYSTEQQIPRPVDKRRKRRCSI
jgi:hypothetical protein